MRPSKKLFRFPSGFVAASALYSPCRCCCTFVLRSRRLTLSSCKRTYPQETDEKKLLPLASISFTLFPLLPPDVSLSSKALPPPPPPPSSLSKAHQREGEEDINKRGRHSLPCLSRPHAQSWHSRRLGGETDCWDGFRLHGDRRTDGRREGEGKWELFFRPLLLPFFSAPFHGGKVFFSLSWRPPGGKEKGQTELHSKASAYAEDSLQLSYYSAYIHERI